MSVVRRSEITPESSGEGRGRYLAYSKDMMLVVLEVDDGPRDEPDPPHSHPHQQISYVAEGELLFFLGGTPHEVEAGDLIVIPPDVPHTIQPRTRRVKLIDAFHPVREDFLS